MPSLQAFALVGCNFVFHVSAMPCYELVSCEEMSAQPPACMSTAVVEGLPAGPGNGYGPPNTPGSDC